MFNVRLAGGHLSGKQLFTWLSLVVSLMASFVLSLFPLDVLDEIWDLIESVSEGFLTYSDTTIFLGADILVYWIGKIVRTYAKKPKLGFKGHADNNRVRRKQWRDLRSQQNTGN